MSARMVPQLLGSPGRMMVIDCEGCLSLEVETERKGDSLLCHIRDYDTPGMREPRTASFYSVSDRSLFLKALLDDRLKTVASYAPRRYEFRPRLVRS